MSDLILDVDLKTDGSGRHMADGGDVASAHGFATGSLSS
jgi:hypothetical protein